MYTYTNIKQKITYLLENNKHESFFGTWNSDFRPLEPVLGKKYQPDFESAIKQY